VRLMPPVSPKGVTGTCSTLYGILQGVHREAYTGRIPPTKGVPGGIYRWYTLLGGSREHLMQE